MKNVRILRDKYGFSQNDISKYLNISRESYSKIELGLREITTIESLKSSFLYEESIYYILDLEVDDNMDNIIDVLIINKVIYEKLRRKIENNNLINKKIDDLLRNSKSRMY